jgi:nitrogen regulatory protein P-II 1
MKQIKAIIQPSRLERLREAFRKLPEFPGMTLVRAEGAGYHPHWGAVQGVKAELTDYTNKLRIEIVAPDAQAQQIVETILAVCHSGQPGDGVVWVSPVESFHRIRDGG